MTIGRITCILCGMHDATHLWKTPEGDDVCTCHGMNRPEHIGRRVTWNLTTGQELRPSDPEQHKIMEVFLKGKPRDMRGYPADFLYKKCGIVWITAIDIANIFGHDHGLYDWAKEREMSGFFISALPLWCLTKVTGIQFRAFSIDTGDANGGSENTRNFGRDGLFTPNIAGHNFDGAVVHEGPWGAVAQLSDAMEYGGSNMAAIAVTSASTKAEVVKATCNQLLPGIPVFILADNDQAGWTLRFRQKDVGYLISLPAVGDAKDYRDLPSDYRFEELAKIVHRHLQERDRAGGTKIPLNDEEISIRLAKVIRTEFGLATRFVTRFGRNCKFVEEWGKWVVYDGKVWKPSSMTASLYAQITIKALTHEALYVDLP